jgi:hypothetical protein
MLYILVNLSFIIAVICACIMSIMMLDNISSCTYINRIIVSFIIGVAVFIVLFLILQRCTY